MLEKIGHFIEKSTTILDVSKKSITFFTEAFTFGLEGTNEVLMTYLHHTSSCVTKYHYFHHVEFVALTSRVLLHSSLHHKRQASWKVLVNFTQENKKHALSPLFSALSPFGFPFAADGANSCLFRVHVGRMYANIRPTLNFSNISIPRQHATNVYCDVVW